MKRIIIGILFFMVTSTTVVNGQSLADTTFYTTLARIQEAYWTGSYIQFKVGYSYLERDSTGVVSDTMTISYQINKENFYMIGDSVESMQNGTYRVTVYNQDSLMQVERPTSIQYQLFKVNIDDNDFKEAFVSGFTKTDTAGYRKVGIVFNSNAPYLNYEIIYDTSTYQIYSVLYRMKKGNYLTPASESLLLSVPEGFISVYLKFSGFAANAFGDAVFEQGRFFTSQNGKLLPVSPYLNFELINSIVE